MYGVTAQYGATAAQVEVILVLLGLGFLALVAVVGAVWIVRRRRTPADLRGDWWPAFEAEFRAYARRAATSRPPREHRREGDSSAG